MRSLGFTLLLALGLVCPAAICSATTPVAADPLASLVRASGTVQMGGLSVHVSFLSDGTSGALRAVGPDGEAMKELTRTDEVLAILADRKLAFLWPAVEAWSGAGLVPLRDRLVERAALAFAQGAAADAPTNVAQSSIPDRDRALLQYADALDHAGRAADAIAAIDRELADTALRSGEDPADRAMLTLRRSTLLGDTKGWAAAIASLGDAAGKVSPDYRLNFEVSRAAFLAEDARYAEALATIDHAQAAFAEQVERPDGSDKVPGSNRQFDWIRACALNGLGRKAEAAATLARAMAERVPTDSPYALDAASKLRLRSATCMRDKQRIVAALLADLSEMPFGSPALLWLEPGRIVEHLPPDLVAAVRGDLRLRMIAADRVRVLSADFTPALNDWQSAPLP